ncbi:MAG: Hpt domain-containing protein, partial [Firmicutes bacterium]|nr:Hpt domain-containing protein [Bacillota bacterium]
MLTIEKLKEFGADTEAGLTRCMNNEEFYFRLIGMAAKDPNFEKLEIALAMEEPDDAFEAAHALKGVLGNLSLTPLLEPVAEMTELLRARADADYAPLMAKIDEKLAELKALAAE